MDRTRVLLVEDNRVDQMAFERVCREENLPYDYKIASSISEGKQMLATEKFDVVILDYFLSDGTAFDILDTRLDPPVIVATGTGNEEIAVRAMKAGAYDYLIKDPQSRYIEVLPATLDNVIKRRKSEDRTRILSHAIMNISDCVYITDLEGNIIYVNEAFCRTYGYDQDEVVGRTDAIIWKDGDASSESVEIGSRGETLSIRKDGSEFPVLLSRSFIYTEDEEKSGVVGVVSDITELKRSAEALRKLYRAIEQTPVAVVITDGEGKIEYVNPWFTRLTGYTAKEVVGNTTDVLNSGKHTPEFFEDMWSTIRSGKVWRGEFHNKKKNGELYWEDATISPVMNEEGEITHYIAVKEDVTERKQARADRERLIAELEEALARIKTLRGLIPICSNCKKIRDDKGYWKKIETYIQAHSEAEFTHGICPDCAESFGKE